MTSVIICAAGTGSRAGFQENKILREYNGLCVLSYSLSAFSPFADEIVIACREEDDEKIKELIRPFPSARLSRGGKTRMESVFNALKTVKGEIVLIHDAPLCDAKTDYILHFCRQGVRKRRLRTPRK